MKHSIQSEGFGVRLRPAGVEDSNFIIWLRNLDHARGRVGDSATGPERQKAWFEEYVQRLGDYYFLIETIQRVPVGTYGLYDLIEGSAESGRWIVRPEVPAAIPSAILGLDIAFQTLGLRELRATTVSTNQRVLSLNRKFGFKQVRVDQAAQVIGGQPADLVRFILPASTWPSIREKLVAPATLAAKEVTEWEQHKLAPGNQDHF